MKRGEYKERNWNVSTVQTLQLNVYKGWWRTEKEKVTWCLGHRWNIQGRRWRTMFMETTKWKWSSKNSVREFWGWTENIGKPSRDTRRGFFKQRQFEESLKRSGTWTFQGCGKIWMDMVSDGFVGWEKGSFVQCLFKEKMSSPTEKEAGKRRGAEARKPWRLTDIHVNK